MSDDMVIMMSDHLTILPNTKIKLFSPGLLLHSAEDGREEQEEVGDLVNHGDNRDEGEDLCITLNVPTLTLFTF